MFFLLKPEVAGGWGPNIKAHRKTHPPVISHLHYEFEGWLGDDLLTTFPEFIVTERLATALETSELTGFRLAAVEISAGGMWTQLYPDRAPPQCRWLKLTSPAGKADGAGGIGGIQAGPGFPPEFYAGRVRGASVD